MKVHTHRVIAEFPNKTVVAAHCDDDFLEVSIYRSKGNTDIYEAVPVGPDRILIGDYLRTDYRS